MHTSYEIYVDWDNDGNFTGPYDNITADVVTIQLELGRDYASQLTGRSIAGKAVFLLNNNDGKYSPFNSSSVLFGNLLPSRKIQVVMDISGTPVTIWTGFFDVIRPKPDISRLKRANLIGIGALGQIRERKTNVAMQTSIATGDAIDVLLDRIGWPSSDRDIDTGTITMSRWWVGAQLNVLDSLRALEITEGGFLRETRDGKIAFDDISLRLSGSAILTFSDVSGSTYMYNNIVQEDLLKQVYNVFIAKVHTYTIETLATIWTLNEIPAILSGQTLTFYAEHPNASSAINVKGVALWETPIQVSDIVGNRLANGSGGDITSDMSIVATKYDTRMEIKVTNDGAFSGFLTTVQARGTSLTENEEIISEIKDETSIANYGEREFPLDAGFYPSREIANVRLDWYKSQYADPTPVLALTFSAFRNDSLAALAQSIDLNQRLTIVADNEATELGINTDFYVESIRHSIGVAGKTHQVTLKLSEAWVWSFADFWQLGSSQLGDNTRLGV